MIENSKKKINLEETYLFINQINLSFKNKINQLEETNPFKKEEAENINAVSTFERTLQ